MFNHSSCNEKVVNECLERIDLYKKKKRDDIFDDFYRSHLYCFESLIDDWKKQKENCFAVIICKEGHKSESGVISPVYATICKSPHWTVEGVMLQSGIYDATKFDVDSEDLPIFVKYCNEHFKDRTFDFVLIDKSILGSCPREVWSNEAVNCGFAKNKIFKGVELE